MPTGRVDTKTAPRRTLKLRSWDDLDAELDRIEAAARNGTAGHTGNWTPGEIADHCATFLRSAIDGFETRPPGIVSAIGRLLFLRKATGPDPMPSGFSTVRSLAPTPEVSDLDGIEELRRQVARVRGGERMTHPSPLLGRLSHEQWETIQLKHCAMHLGFVSLGGGGEAPPEPRHDAEPAPGAGEGGG